MSVVCGLAAGRSTRCAGQFGFASMPYRVESTICAASRTHYLPEDYVSSVSRGKLSAGRAVGICRKMTIFLPPPLKLGWLFAGRGNQPPTVLLPGKKALMALFVSPSEASG